MIMMIVYAIIMTIAVFFLLAISSICMFLFGLFFRALDVVMDLFKKGETYDKK